MNSLIVIIALVPFISEVSAVCKTVNGGYGDWGDWHPCSVTCGQGTKKRYRHCDNPRPMYGGAKCSGDNVETATCNTGRECPIPVNGGWGAWGKWQPCSVTCGKGIKKQYRHCNNPRPMYGGQSCSGDSYNTAECDSGVDCPIDGGWGSWVKGECDCEKGKVTSTRKCNSPLPLHCGKPCDGINTKYEDCHEHCPIDGQWSDWDCGVCGPRDGKLGCEEKCTRECNNPAPKYGGKYCVGSPTKVKDCSGALDCQSFPLPGVCAHCVNNAKGTPCRAHGEPCKELKSLGMSGGKYNQYPANDWFFLHCGADDDWCKPCATKTLKYNAKCNQCEATADGPCTGPSNGKRAFLDELDDENLW